MVFGTQISDYDFFMEVIDLTLPRLESLKAAVENSDFARSRQLFAEYVRNSLQPELFFSIPARELQNAFYLPNETIEDIGDRILSLKLVSTGTPHQFSEKVDWASNPTFNKYPEWTFQLNRHWEFIVLSMRYKETGDEKYAEGLVNLFSSWIHQVVAPDQQTVFHATFGWRTIECGIRMANAWPYALHACYRSPHFTDDVLIDWYKSLWEHGKRLREMHRNEGNWLLMEMNGLSHIAVLCPVFQASDEWRKYAEEQLIKELGKQIYPDGFQIELTTNYHEVVLINYFQVIHLYQAYGIPVANEIIELLENACSLPIKLMMPDGLLPDVNDGRWLKVSTSTSLRDAVKLFPHREDFLWVFTEGREGKSPIETSIPLNNSGYYVMRNSWDREAVWALFDAGPFGTGHQHEDKLNLLIHAYGKLLLTEGGNYAYDDSEMRRYVKSTRSHNTVRVDRGDQNRRLNYQWQDEDLILECDTKWQTTAEYDYVQGTYDEGYGDLALIDVRHTRSILFIKNHSQLPPCFIVIDDLEPRDNHVHTYEFLWHLQSEFAAIQGLKAFTLQDEGPILTIIPSLNEHLTVKIVQGQENPEWQGWRNTHRFEQGEYAPTPTIIYELKATGCICVATLLFPTKPGETCPVERIEITGVAGVREIRLLLQNKQTVVIHEAELFSNL